MLRSLYSGVSGLLNHQTRMDVIGNNVSNVNTTGFKKGRANFQDLISQTLQGAARPRPEVGGVNPTQVGLGMQIAAIDTLHTQGSLRSTGVKSDVALQGEGFFVLRESGQLLYTRAGNFNVDQDGSLVNPATGQRVQGWNAQLVGGQTIIDTGAAIEDLVIPVGSKDGAAATTLVALSSNLDKNTSIIPAVGATAADIAAGTWQVEYNIYDSFGNLHELRIDFTRIDGTPNSWNAVVTVDADAAVVPPQGLAVGGVASVDGQSFIVDFNSDGTLLQLRNVEGGLANVGELGVEFTFTVPDSEAVGGAPVAQATTINLGTVGSFVDSITQFAAPSSTRIFSQNGYGLGYLEDYRIDRSGTIVGIFSNGTNRILGQMAVSTFTNPGGLEKAGETNFIETINSGIADIGTSGVTGRGDIIAGTLELSNVDLAEEFTDMIVTQRGFQANSRTITTSDQMLQELLTLKR